MASVTSKAVKDISLLAMLTVLLILVIVVVSAYGIVKFLRSVLDKGKDIGPAGQCAVEIAAMQAVYQNSADPNTGGNYDKCGAAKKAVNAIVGRSGSPCPQVPAPFDGSPPYSIYVKAQCGET